MSLKLMSQRQLTDLRRLKSLLTKIKIKYKLY